MEILVLDAGIRTESCRAMMAFLILVNISAIGSVTLISSFSYLQLPARLDDAGDYAFTGQFTEANTTQTKAPYIASGPPAAIAPVAHPHLEFAFLFPLDHGYFGHSQLLLNGIPSNANKRRPSSSVLAVVIMLISIPRILSILS